MIALNSISGSCNKSLVLKGFASRRVLYVLQAACLAVLVGGCYAGYHWYRVSREQAAQKRFSDGVKEFNNTLTAQVGHQNWSMIAEVFGLGAQEYAGTSLAPFYLAYQAQALLKDNKITEAAEVMSHAVRLMKPESDFYFMLKLKAILMTMDQHEAKGDYPDDATRKSSDDEFERQLTDLAYNSKNKQRDEALFYLGRYYVSKDNKVRAQEVLQELINESGKVSSTDVGTSSVKDADAISPWAQEADRLLKQVAV